MVALSARATALLARIKSGRIYTWERSRNIKAMAELEAAGLVVTCGVPIVIACCYVPATGYTPYKPPQMES